MLKEKEKKSKHFPIMTNVLFPEGSNLVFIFLLIKLSVKWMYFCTVIHSLKPFFNHYQKVCSECW